MVPHHILMSRSEKLPWVLGALHQCAGRLCPPHCVTKSRRDRSIAAIHLVDEMHHSGGNFCKSSLFALLAIHLPTTPSHPLPHTALRGIKIANRTLPFSRPKPFAHLFQGYYFFPAERSPCVLSYSHSPRPVSFRAVVFQVTNLVYLPIPFS